MEILSHKAFKKQFQKLPLKVKKKFFDKMELFLNNQFHPLLNNHAVDGVYLGWRSINITGDYRALYEQKSEDVVMFMRIGTHSELYG